MDLSTETENDVEHDILDTQIDSERGASMVEYALLITFIAIVSIIALTTLGTTVSGEFSLINSGFDS